MGKPTGFKEYTRQTSPQRDPLVRLNDFYEIYGRPEEDVLKRQGARCMDCGVPFCQSATGCPIDNLIPEWNDLIYQGRWRDAFDRLRKTNNFPEFTGRICPAPCESACVLGITEPPVAIKSIECEIIDRAWDEGWMVPEPPVVRTGKTVAIIGSGPAGLAAADQLNKKGHTVTVYERDDRIGGLLMYGVPNMKLEKKVIDRRVQLMRDEGVNFKVNCNVGNAEKADIAHHGSAGEAEHVDINKLRDEFDAVILACGALSGRDLKLPGRELNGVHMAMSYLWETTRDMLDQNKQPESITAEGKNVIVIGGGDTGTDCIGTALRQGCTTLTNITRRNQEPEERDENHPWPGPRGTFFVDYGHAEGAAKYGRDPREYCCQPLEFVGDGSGNVKAMRIEKLNWKQENGRWVKENTGQIVDLPAELILISAGFVGHDTPSLLERLGLNQEDGNVPLASGERPKDNLAGGYKTAEDKIFVAGDMRRGASLIVWAIAEGRGAAEEVDQFLLSS